jgi:hypothetical protein
MFKSKALKLFCVGSFSTITYLVCCLNSGRNVCPVSNAILEMKKAIIIDELENSTVLCDSVPLELTVPILGRYLLGEGQAPNEQRSPGPT